MDGGMKTLEGIVVSNLAILLLLGLSTFLAKKSLMRPEGTRKLIHIGASNWWFIAMYYFDSALTAAIVPVMFVIVNLVHYKKHLFMSMVRKETPKDLGPIYYAISLLCLSLWTFHIGRPEIGGIGVLIMGYADGFAALVGSKFGKVKLIYGKTLAGTLTGFVTAMVVVVGFNAIYQMDLKWAAVFVISLYATLAELLAPKGLDNLAVPIGCSLLVYLFV